MSYRASFKRRLAETGPMPLTWAVLGPKLFPFFPIIVSAALCGAILISFHLEQNALEVKKSAEEWTSAAAGMMTEVRLLSVGRDDYSAASSSMLSGFGRPPGAAAPEVVPVEGADGAYGKVQLRLEGVPAPACAEMLSTYLGVGMVGIEVRSAGTATSYPPEMDGNAAVRACGAGPVDVGLTFS